MLRRVAYLLNACLLLSLYFPSPSRSQCSPINSGVFASYSLSIAPEDFDGMSTQGNCETSCTGSAIPVLAHRLANGVTGPQTLDISVVNAWSQTVTITGGFNTNVRVSGVNLYFYHIPSRGIGLPYDIRVQSGAVEYALEGNLDLSQDDNQLRNVTIVPDTLPAASQDFVIQFTFSDIDQIDWLLLTEVEFCTTTSGMALPAPPPITFSADTVSSVSPSTVNSTITLTCSVATEGRFVWSWPGPAGLPPFSVLNAGRTSTLQLSELSSDDAGTYQCQATHTYGTTPPSASFDITLSLSGTVQALYSEVIVSEDNETATLSCMLYGYLRPGVQPTITWGNPNTITNNSIFTITTEDGDMLIQNGGTEPIPSLISTLTVNITTLQSTATQVYSCSSGQVAVGTSLAVIQLSITEGGPTTQPPTTTPGPTVDDNLSDLPVIVGVIVAVIVLLVVIIIVVVVFIVCMKKRSQRAQPFIEDYDYDNKDPLYQEVTKPLPPPLPARFPNVSASEIGPYAVVENGIGGGQMELVNMNGGQRNSIHDPTPQRLKSEPGFLQNNPLYASADNIDKAADVPSLPRRRVLGSVSSMGEMSNSTQGSILNIYARPFKASPPPIPDRPPTPLLMDDDNVYSEALSPSMLTEKRYSTPPGMSPSSTASVEVCPASSIYADPQPLLREEGPVEIAPKQVKEVRSLGVGQFGQVVLAETIGLSLQDLRLSETNNDRNIAVLVAIKRLKPDADECVKEAFEKEIKFMSRLNHKNVVRLLGICPYGSCFIVMEYMENGDLNQYLQKHSESNDRLSADTLLYMATQISSGMMYLATLKFIHRDLATRNCLVGSNNEVKIADFGMSRSLYSSYYYRIRGRAMLPIRWMANECFYGRFSEKTDIWAFGVTMWEIFTFGVKQPYDEMTDQEVIDDAIKGPDRQVPQRPDYCPEEVYDVMLRCWVDEPDDRANFEEVHSSLASIYEHTDL